MRPWFLAAVLSVALIAGACGDSSDDEGTPSATTEASSEGAKPGGALVDLQTYAAGDPDHIDPGLAGTLAGAQTAALLYDGLTDIDYATGELKPNVAESFESNDAGDVWTFKIREGVKFHNGEPVLPSDFKASWERVVQKEFASEVAYHFDPIKGKKAIDDGTAKDLSGVKADDEAMTLTVELEFPFQAFGNVVQHTVFSPLPKSELAKPDTGKYEQGLMVGNGPFKMAEPWKHDQYIKLVRNDDYWGGLNEHDAYVDSLEMRISKDEDSGFAEFEAGGGQLAKIPAGRFAEVRETYKDHLGDRAILGVYYWAFNMKDPVLGGAKGLPLRKAISLAIDRQAIIDSVYNGTRKVSTGITPDGIPGFKKDLAKFAPATPDVEAAKKLVAEYGKVTTPLKLNFGAGAGHEDVATIIQANLKAIGIPSEPAPIDSTIYFKEMRQGKGQLLRAGWFWDYVSYDNGMYPLFHSASIGGDNLAQYENPAFDKIVDEARRTADEDARNELYNKAEDLLLNTDVVATPLNWYTGTIAYSETVKGFVLSPLGFVAYDDIWLG